MKLTVPEAQARTDEWTREHYGHPAQHAWASISYRWKDGLDPRLSREQVEDGANRWLELKAAERRERVQRQLAEAERSEAFGEAIIEHLRRDG